ncbi:MAG: hypothetical protein DRJ03_25480 [Chloroflexi bacterium]|nr:MAG: hypothetical protein DRJ03_25480 [Chloroflexota bacterium]
MSVLFIDSREPKQVTSVVQRIAAYEGLRCHVTPLEYGDYATEHAVCERKTAEDLLASSKDGRLFRQLGHALAVDKEMMLLVTGTTEPVDALYGLIASVMVRYGFQVLHEQSEQAGLWIMVKWLKKCEQRAQGRPHKLAVEVLVAKLLGVPLNVAQHIVVQYKPRELFALVTQGAEELKQVPGVGKRRIEQMQARMEQWLRYY